MTRKKLPESSRRSLKINIRFKSGIEAVLKEAVERSGCDTVSHFVRVAVLDYIKRLTGINPEASAPPKPKAEVRAVPASQVRAENYSQASPDDEIGF